MASRIHVAPLHWLRGAAPFFMKWSRAHHLLSFYTCDITSGCRRTRRADWILVAKACCWWWWWWWWWISCTEGGATLPEVCGHICGILMIVSFAATTAFHQVSEPTNCTTRTTDNFKCLFVLQLYISVVRVLMLTWLKGRKTSSVCVK